MRDTGFGTPVVGQERVLPSVPLFDVRAPAAETLMRLAPERLELLIAHGRRHYGDVALALGDRATWQWLEITANPYRNEIRGVRRSLGRPGAVLLNLSYEWCCSAGVGPDPAGTGNRMLRTLDWPMHGLGRAVVVARQEGGGRPVLQRNLARLRRRADGNGARSLQRRDQSAAVAPIHPLLLVRLAARPALDVATGWLAALAPAAPGVR